VIDGRLTASLSIETNGVEIDSAPVERQAARIAEKILTPAGELFSSKTMTRRRPECATHRSTCHRWL